MSRVLRWIGVISLLAILYPSAVLAQKAPSDDVIYDKVRLRLASDTDVNGGALEVDVKDGVVTVRGKVKTERGRAKIDKLTRKVKGVKQVVNEVKVDPL